MTFWVGGMNDAPVNRLEHSHLAHEVSVNRSEQPAKTTGKYQQRAPNPNVGAIKGSLESILYVLQRHAHIKLIT